MKKKYLAEIKRLLKRDVLPHFETDGWDLDFNLYVSLAHQRVHGFDMGMLFMHEAAKQGITFQMTDDGLKMQKPKGPKPGKEYRLTVTVEKSTAKRWAKQARSKK